MMETTLHLLELARRIARKCKADSDIVRHIDSAIALTRRELCRLSLKEK